MMPLRAMVKRRVKDPLRNAFWALYGRGIRNPATIPDATSFLFVCRGNICRSPFCAGIAGKISTERNRGSIVSESAGIEVAHSLPPPEDAILAADRFGVDLRGHRSRKVDDVLLERFDAVVVMEAWQYLHMRKIFPGFREKIFLLPLFEGEGSARENHYHAFHIGDPFGKPIEQFRLCFQRIERSVDAMLETMAR
jgi:protein-tyrosine phosphatase